MLRGQLDLAWKNIASYATFVYDIHDNYFENRGEAQGSGRYAFGISNFSISGSTLQVAATLSEGTYSVTIRTTDASGPTYDETFTTTLPVTSLSPADNSTGIAFFTVIITFDSAPTVGTGNITLKQTSDDSTATIDVTGSSVSISGNAVTITFLVRFTFGTEYYILINSTAINNYSGISSTTDWSFTTVSK